MGLGAALTGGIMMMMLAIVTGMAVPAILGANAGVSAAASQRLKLDDLQSKSVISITDIQAQHSNPNISFVLNNTGSTKIWNYAHFTVLVTYNAEVAPSVGAVQTEQFSYAGISSSPGSGGWSIGQFYNDLADPKIINPSEAAQIVCGLPHPLYSNGTVTVVVSTDTGALASKSGEIS